MATSSHDSAPTTGTERQLVPPGITGGDWYVGIDETARVRQQLALRATQFAEDRTLALRVRFGIASEEEEADLGRRHAFRVGQDYN